MSDYLIEAFQKLRLVEEDIDLTTIDKDKIDELRSFVADDIDETPVEEIIDVNAATEDELADNYVGKIVLECNCCNGKFYKDKADVVIEEDMANPKETCPICGNELGFTVIGKVAPFEKSKDIDITVNDEDVVEPALESLSRVTNGGNLKFNEEVETCPECGKSPCECEKVEEACSKKTKKDSMWDKLKKKNPELKESVEKKGFSKEAIEEFYSRLDHFLKHYKYSIRRFLKNPYDPENSVSDIFDSSEYISDNLKELALKAGPEGSKKYWKKYDELWDDLRAQAVDYIAEKTGIDIDESLKEQKLTEEPWTTETRWVWKDEPKNSKRKDPHKRIYQGGHEFTGYYESDRIYATAKDLGISDKEFNKNMDKIDKILTKGGWSSIWASNVLEEDPSLQKFLDLLARYIGDSLDYPGEVDFTIPRPVKHPQTGEPAIKFSINDIEFNGKKLSALENSSEIDQAVEALLNDPEWVKYFKEEGKDIIKTAGLSKNIDPLLAFCKFEAEIDEMPEEGPIADFLAEFDPEDEIEIDEDDFVKRLGEVALEKFGPEAWAKCKLKPGDFYDFGESLDEQKLTEGGSIWDKLVAAFPELDEDYNTPKRYKESVELTATGEDNVKVSKNDDGSMDINVSSTEPGEGEEIVPLDDEEQQEIENNTPEEEESAEEGTEETSEEGGEEGTEGTEGEESTEGGEEEIGEFEETSFDEMGESYMRRVYSNVKSYQTKNVSDNGKSLMVEGVITFRSGSTKNTTFVLTPRKTKYNKTILEGYNKTFSNSSKAFKVIGATDNGRFYPKTFRYNYKTRMMNESNKSEVFKIQGIIKATGSKKYGK